jgi:hypothetical protein
MFCGQVLTAWMIDSTAVCRFSGGVDGRVCLGRRPKPLLAARARPRTTADEGQTCLRRCSGVESIIQLRGACGWFLPRRFAGSAVDAQFRASAVSAGAAPTRSGRRQEHKCAVRASGADLAVACDPAQPFMFPRMAPASRGPAPIAARHVPAHQAVCTLPLPTLARSPCVPASCPWGAPPQGCAFQGMSR